MHIFNKHIFFLAGFILGILIAANVIGIIIGNTLYLMLNKQGLSNLVPALVDYSQNVEQIKKYEVEKKWEHVSITASDGYIMTGTYIKNPIPTDKSVLIMHGLYQNRSMSISYVPLYQKLGFNVLLVDLRGHGESQGELTWGKNETTDIDKWMEYLKDQKGNRIIGIQGISLGAAYALLHSGSNSPINADFYVEDSSYDDLSDIYQEKLQSFLQLDNNDTFIVHVLWFYCQAAMYWHTGETMTSLSPLRAVFHDQKPILFLHGGADTLVPVSSMQKLYAACPSYKELHIFPNAQHAVAISSDPDEYYNVLKQFLTNIGIVK